MAQILITNYTGYVPSDIIMYAPSDPNSCPNCSPDYGTVYNITALNGGLQATPGMEPTYFPIPSIFDNVQYAFVQLSASTFLQSIPQLIDCSAEGPITTFKFEKCGVGTDKNIYVFYDASGYFPDGLYNGIGDVYTLSAASTNIRLWYNDLYTYSGYTGFLFEIPLVNKRFINWPCYPYLGSTTGGTLSDNVTEVRIEAGSVLIPGMPGAQGNYMNQVWNSPIISRIALAQDLGTGAALPTTGGFSSGVPFPHWEYTVSGALLGQFVGGDTNYVSIIVGGHNGSFEGCFENWATSGGTYFYQPYFSTQSATTIDNPSDEVTPPTVRIPTPCGEWTNYSAYTDYSGSSLQRDYESYLKVYNDVVNNLNGFMKVLFMPFPSDRIPTNIDPWFMYGQIYQMIELREGEVPSVAGYLEYYAEDPYGYDGGQWSVFNEFLYDIAYADYNAYSIAYDFIPLAYFNNYTGLTATTAYQNLPATAQNGSGLKHFGWEVDPTLTGFSTTVFQRDFEANVATSEFIYLSAGTFTQDYIYSFENNSGVDFEGCWKYIGTRLDGQPILILETVAIFEDCAECYGQPAPLIYKYKYDGFQGSAYQDFDIAVLDSNQNNQPIEILSVGNVDFDLNVSFPYLSNFVTPPNTLNRPGRLRLFSGNTTIINTFIESPYSSIGATVSTQGVIQDFESVSIRYLAAGGGPSTNNYIYATIEVTGVTPSSVVYDAYGNHQLSTSQTGGTIDDSDGRFHLIFLTSSVKNTIMCLGEDANNISSNATSGDSFAAYTQQQAYLIQSQDGNTNPFAANSDFSIVQVGDFLGSMESPNSDDLIPITTGPGWITLSNAFFTVDGYEAFTEKLSIEIDGNGVITTVGPIEY